MVRILEGTNEVAQYSIDSSTGILYFENVTYPLIPSSRLMFRLNLRNYVMREELPESDH